MRARLFRTDPPVEIPTSAAFDGSYPARTSLPRALRGECYLADTGRAWLQLMSEPCTVSIGNCKS